MGFQLMANRLNREHFESDNLEVIDKCPYCASSTSTHVANEVGFDYLQCDACEIIYLTPRVKEKFAHLIYDYDYHISPNKDYEQIIARKRLALFRFQTGGLRIHEDGAGIGSFAYVAKQAGHDVSASDFGGDSIEKAKAMFGMDVAQGSLEDQNLKSSSLDGLACFNLMCHLYTPWKYIEEVSRVLKPDGFFLCRTGDRRGFFKKWGNLGAPEHNFHYNRKILVRMLRENGLVLRRFFPAFDSDFPFNLILPDAERSAASRAKITLARTIHRTWTSLKLPKEDIFFLAQKK